MQLVKNDKQRIRARCVGTIPACGTSGGIGLGTVPKRKTGPLTRGRGRDVYLRSQKEEPTDCPWLLYVAKDTYKDVWSVRTFKDEHKCLQSREIKACDYKFLSKQILDQVQVNPDIPIKAVQDQLTKQFEVQVSMQKALRAKNKAEIEIRGDHKQQYTILRDYVEELQKTNPNTTVRISVQTATDPSSPTRVFKRMYVCLGALKEGYKACQRELLGLDGAFMRGPFPGQLLTAVGIDSNNGIYPLAYAVVEAENKDSWIWFLDCLADDLDLQANSNYTFISDRQKVMLMRS